MHTYQNVNTGDVRSFAEAQPDLEAAENWRPADDPTDPDVIAELEHAWAVEKATADGIAEAQQRRLDAERAKHDAKLRLLAGTTEANPAFHEPDGGREAEPYGTDHRGILTKQAEQHAEIAARGDGPASQEHMQEVAAFELEHPPTTSVLERQHAEPEPAAEPEPPAKGAPKGDWIAYAVARGADPADVAGKTKAEIIAEYDGDTETA